MLILLRQTSPSADTWDRVFFNTDTSSVVTDTVTDANLRFYEMLEGQYVAPASTGFQYVYDGDGGVDTVPVPSGTNYGLTVFLSFPDPALLVANYLNGFAPGASVPLEAPVIPDHTFVNWTEAISGAVVSTTASFTFTMPASMTFLVANYYETASPPAPDPPAPDNPADPVALPTAFYPLELRIRGVQIPIAGLVQRIHSGIFTEELEGDYSFPINIPLLPEYLNALRHPNDPQSNADFSQPIPCQLWAHGNLRYSGYLDILEATEDLIRASFILSSGFFISQNKNLKLSDCYGDADVITLEGYPLYAVSGYQIQVAYQDYKVTVNSFSRNFLKAEYEDEIEILEAIADWLGGLGLGLDIRIEYAAYTEDLDSVIDQSNYLVYFDTTTVTVCTVDRIIPPNPPSDQYYADPFINARRLTSKRMQMQDFNTVNPANRIAFPSLYNRQLYEGNNPKFSGVVNAYDFNGHLHFSNIDYPVFGDAMKWDYTVIPFLYLIDVVKQVFKKLKIQVSGEFLDDPRMQHLLLYNNRTLDKLRVTWFGFEQERTPANILAGADNPFGAWRYENTIQTSIRLGNHLPDVSVIDFLKGLKNYFGLKYRFNSLQNRVEISFVRSLIRSRSSLRLDQTLSASRKYSIHYPKLNGLAFDYADPDPIMSDGANEIPTPDHTVTNYLALDALGAELGEIAFVQSLQAYFQLVPDQDDPPFWKLYAFKQQSETRDSSEAQAQTWTLSLYPLVDSYTNGRKMPAIECTAHQPEVNLENQECGMRIFGFYGVQDDAADLPYAFASVTAYDAKEMLSEEQYDLYIRSADTFPFWQDLEQLMDQSRYYECALLLTEQELQQLSSGAKFRIANLDYLVDELEVAMSTQEYTIAKAKLYKVK